MEIADKASGDANWSEVKIRVYTRGGYLYDRPWLAAGSVAA